MKWASSEFATELDREQASFLARFPEWRETALLDHLRATEYGRLDREHHVYLDYTGGGLYAASQLEEHMRLLAESVFGNPHSANPTSSAMTQHVDSARRAVLDYFDADPDEYLAVFTPNASGALKLVGEAYPFGPGARLLLTFDNHNSVNGIREFARARGAQFSYLPVHLPDMRIDRAEATRALGENPSPGGASRRHPLPVRSAHGERGAGGGNRLFAFPAQSNFSGVQHPLELIAEAQAAGWDVALDAAAFTPTNRLDLSVWKPDFVSVSFYKMFGYPTGVGCLLMRQSMLAKLRRPWFAGGTILIASVQGDGHYLAPDAAAFEDGTVNYLTLPAVEEGLRHLTGVGIDRVHQRVRCLTGWLLGAMADLRHANGAPAIHVHGPRDLTMRGGTIAFNFLDPAGHMHDIRRIQELANEVNLSLRTGCFCNPGAGEVAFGLGREQIEPFFAEENPIPFEELRARIHERFAKEIGAIRLSVGIASNFADVYRFADFARALLDRTVEEVGRIDPVAGRVGWMRDSA